MPAVGFGAMIYSSAAAHQAVATGLPVSRYRSMKKQLAVPLTRALFPVKIPRQNIFLTTKLWPNQRTGYQATKRQFKQSLRRLNQEYVDLYLIHEPYGNINEEWRALEDLQKAGLVKSIGVSNFNRQQLEQLMTTTKVTPAVDQIESHPRYNENDLVSYCRRQGIVPEAWSALAEGRNNIFHQPTLITIAHQHHKSVAQVILRWDVQRGLIPLAKSTNAARMVENRDIFDFELSPTEINQINQLDTGVSLYPEY